MNEKTEFKFPVLGLVFLPLSLPPQLQAESSQQWWCWGAGRQSPHPRPLPTSCLNPALTPGSLDRRETHRSPLSLAVRQITLASAVQPGRESWLLAYVAPRQFGSLPWWLRW